jgi:DinB superfamily
LSLAADSCKLLSVKPANLLLCVTLALPACAADATLTTKERADLIQYLQDARKEFVESVSSLSDQQWRWKPAPERWSVGECAEHIVLSEEMLFAKAREAMHNPADPEWETKTAGKTELLLRVMAPRLGKATAPEEIVPTGKMPRAEIMSRYDKQRAATLKFAESDLAFKEHIAPHPFPIFNPLNAYQWVLYIPLHNMRHDKQIAEVKATAGFPTE